MEPSRQPRGALGTALMAHRWSTIDRATRREIVLGLFLLLTYGFFQQMSGWNENSRIDLVQALVEDRSTSIDRLHKNTNDKAYYDGHYYSDKAPGIALVGAPIYAVLKVGARITGSGPIEPETAIRTLAFVESGVATVLLVILLLRFLRPAVGEAWALVVSLGFGLGSMALPYATMFYGHAASAFCLFAAFYLLWRWRTQAGMWRPLLAGLLAGGAVLVEIPVVMGVVIVGVYALWLGRRTAAMFVLGGLPMLIVLLGYDWLTFGGPFNIGYQYTTNFAGLNAQGVISVVWPTWARASTVLIGPRGLLHLAPWLVLAPLGLLALRRPALRAEVVVCLAVCGAFVAYNSGALNPLGGWSAGPRYLVPALPFMAILVALAPTVVRPLTACLIAISVAVFVAATLTQPAAPTLYADPLFELWIPRLLAGDIADTVALKRFGIDGAWPLTVLLMGIVAAGIGVVATFRLTPAADRLTRISVIVLVILVAAFAMPWLA